MRIDLEVPFYQKDEAKKLGARWDRRRQLWYVPEGVDPLPFTRWMTLFEEEGELHPNLRAKSYFIAQARLSCWHCKQLTRLYAFILPAGYEALDVADQPQDMEWHAYPRPTLLSYISLLPDNAEKAITTLTLQYWFDRSKTICGSYWMNHCEHCNTKQGDFYGIEDFGSAFQPTSAEEAREIFLREIKEPFSARACYCDYSPGTGFFEYMLGAPKATPPAKPQTNIPPLQQDVPPELPQPTEDRKERRTGLGVWRVIRRFMRAAKGLLSKLRKLLGI